MAKRAQRAPCASGLVQRSTVKGNRALGSQPHGGGILFAGGAAGKLIQSPVTGNAPENCSPAGSVAGCS